MTFIADGGGRTVTNCLVYDQRKVYEIVTSAVLNVCASEPGGEVNRTGETVTKQIVYHIVATSEEFARALYQQKWGSEFQRHTLISIKVLFVLDGEIRWGND